MKKQNLWRYKICEDISSLYKLHDLCWYIPHCLLAMVTRSAIIWVHSSFLKQLTVALSCSHVACAMHALTRIHTFEIVVHYKHVQNWQPGLWMHGSSFRLSNHTLIWTFVGLKIMLWKLVSYDLLKFWASASSSFIKHEYKYLLQQIQFSDFRLSTTVQKCNSNTILFEHIA